MTSVPLDDWGSRALDAAGNERLVRTVLFMAVFFQLWLTAHPFPDLSDPSALQPEAEGNLISQVLAVITTGTLAGFAFAKRLRLVLKAITPILVLTFVWFACSAILSAHPGLAARRVVLASFVIFQAAMFLLLPQDRTHFVRMLTFGSLVVLILCYAGVIFAPGLSIHQATDIAEPQLAGNWRGFFAHKNGAGAGMSIFVISGIYIFRTFSRVLGSLIVALAAVFLFFTESKSPIMLLPLALLFSVIMVKLRSPTLKFIIAISVPVMICLLTIGSVASDAIYAVVEKLISDPTFTGRNDIWEFALDHIAQRPLVGFGYQAFWGTSELVNSWTWTESWGYRASDAHNGYVNIAVMTGLVGLALALGWAFVQPFIDHLRTPAQGIDRALNMMFVQIWLFGLYLSGFESELFNNGSVVWFMTAAAVIGLRFQTAAEYPGETA
ncbi:MAG: O-antigen ligase family protein [Bradyrhizobiaceae bacterium]|nr:O-antigen ligase family protein [Hyphomicrobiales bacterium]MBV9427926.1 O-antigen ligase family protein [Bradyrhizobiaceae bacterium]